LCDDGNPFLAYQFLYSLECTGCLGQHNGWYPRYFLLWEGDKNKQLVGAMPAYLKTNSYGEFVFDWAWAESYERNNMAYYPKLVCSIPFTPCTGQRILVHPTLDRNETMVMLANAARQFCVSEKYSSVHWLFLTKKQSDVLSANAVALRNDSDNNSDQQITTDNKNVDVESVSDSEAEHEADNSDKHSHMGKTTYNSSADNEEDSSVAPASLNLLRRIDCQYHWRNRGYKCFDDFLDQCTSKRRKTIKRERRHVTDAGLKVEKRMGSTLSEQEWEWVHEMYESTFDRKWGNPSLTFQFFQRIGKLFGDNVLIILVYDERSTTAERPIACSIMFVGENVLYGRYWGCREQHNSLHFEACYYQGIEFCIDNGLTVFEPGAQGEHKITRGFIPTITRSAHYIAHPGFERAIADFLDEETQHVEHRCSGLTELLPFKQKLILSNVPE